VLSPEYEPFWIEPPPGYRKYNYLKVPPDVLAPDRRITLEIWDISTPRRTFDFSHSEVTIGSGSDNDLVLPHVEVENHHARIVCFDRKLVLFDLQTSYGTYIWRKQFSRSDKCDADTFPHRIRSCYPVEPVDDLEIGPWHMVVSLAK
jgi:hypothetical protein